MARTDKLRQSQLELQAGQSGESATQRSHESLISSRHRNADRAQQASQFDSSIEQRNLDRYQRQWEERRKATAERDRVRAENQAAKPRTTNFGGEGFLPGQERRPSGDPRVDEQGRQFDERQSQQQSQFEQGQLQQQGQFDTRTDLQAASQGLERGGAEANPRLQALQTEMAQRQKEQMGQPLEQRGQKGFVPTQGAEQKSAQDANLAEREMQAKEVNAAANLARARTSHARLGAQEKAATTAASKKEFAAKQKIVENILEQPIKSDVGRLDRFMKGDETLADWQTLKAMLTKVPPVGLARAIHDEANTGEVGPAITRFLNAKISASAIEFIYATGKLPDGKLVDFSSEGMQQFTRAAKEARQLTLPNTVAGQLLSEEDVGKVKRGYADHLEIVNKLAALLVLKGQSTGMMPATTAQQEATHEQRRADPSQPFSPAERAGQVTPAEAASRAGQSYDPASLPTKQPYVPPREYPRADQAEPDPFGRV